MKKLIIIITALLSALACTNLDDILDQLRDHEQRIQKLEALCTQLNSNVEAIQTILTALEQNDYITDITKITEAGIEIGYSITFAKGGTVNIYHGSNGTDSPAPKIGIRKASDGEYYWTSNDEWLTDENGEKIPASVPNDPDDKYITPSFRIAEGVWYISYDGGDSWKEMNMIESGGFCQLVQSIDYDKEYVYLTLETGEVLTIPLNDSNKYSSAECVAAFVEEMNRMAKYIGADNSVFYDPVGIENTSTTYDMAHIALYGSGYDKLWDVWSTPEYTVRLYKDGSSRTKKVQSLLYSSDSDVLTGHYQVLGGKGGTLSKPKIYNLISICQSRINPDDLYLICVFNADGSNSETGNRFQATKEIMDYIESTYSPETMPTDILDETAWEDMSFRDIFIKHNKAARINDNDLSGYVINSGSPKLVYNDEDALGYVKPYAIKASGKVSQHFKSPFTISDYPYFVAANVKVDRHSNGYCGVAFGKNSDACISGKTDGWVSSSAILDGWDNSGNTSATNIYIGSAFSADLDGYVNNPVVIPMSIFKNPPTESQLRELYDQYTSLLIELGGSDKITYGPDVSCNQAYAIKIPPHNPWAYKHIDLEPIYEKNCKDLVYPASTSKILTTIVTLNYITDLKERVLIKQETIDLLPSGFYKNDILAGETVSYEDLLYLLMLPSSNAASMVIAQNVGEKILRMQDLLDE